MERFNSAHSRLPLIHKQNSHFYRSSVTTQVPMGRFHATLGTMIVPRKACQCALCTHEWLPSKSKQNPTGDPRKVKRCASCKSFTWNADDPKVIAARQTKAKMPEIQAEAFAPSGYWHIPKNSGIYAGLERASDPAKPFSGVGRSICKHRVLLAHCELCNPPAVPA